MPLGTRLSMWREKIISTYTLLERQYFHLEFIGFSEDYLHSWIYIWVRRCYENTKFNHKPTNQLIRKCLSMLSKLFYLIKSLLRCRWPIFHIILKSVKDFPKIFEKFQASIELFWIFSFAFLSMRLVSTIHIACFITNFFTSTYTKNITNGKHRSR